MYLVAGLVILILVSFGCSEVTTPQLVQLENFTLCQGRNEEGLPLELESPVPANEEGICVCGDFVMSRSHYMQIIWIRERDVLGSERVQRDLRSYRSGPFLSCLESDGEYDTGDYTVVAILEKTTLGTVEFTVTEAP